MKHLITRLAVAGLALGGGMAAVEAATVTKRPEFGCYQAVSANVHVRENASGTGALLGSARKGETLVKRKRLCNLGGWCAVTYNARAGYAEKKLLKVVACPASLSQPAKQ